MVDIEVVDNAVEAGMTAVDSQAADGQTGRDIVDIWDLVDRAVCKDTGSCDEDEVVAHQAGTAYDLAPSCSF